jgi:hypothetical protein
LTARATYLGDLTVPPHLALLGPADDPLHVVRFGARFDAQGVLAKEMLSGS